MDSAVGGEFNCPSCGQLILLDLFPGERKFVSRSASSPRATRVSGAPVERVYAETEPAQKEPAFVPAPAPAADDSAARLTRLQTERDLLAQQVALASEALSEARTRESALEREAADRQTLLKQLRSENDGLGRSKAAACAESAGRQERIAALEAQLAESREFQTAAARESMAIRKESEEMRIRLGTEILQVRAEAAQLQVERDQFQSDLALNHELTEFVALKRAKEEVDARLAAAVSDLARTRAGLEAAQTELAAIKQERIELNLKVASLQDTVSSSKLAHDNEVLRGIVERQRQELQDRPPAKRKR